MADMTKKPSTDGKPKSINKSALLDQLATGSGLSKKEVAAVFAALNKEVQGQVGKKGPGLLNVFGLVKVYRGSKPATKEATKPNPFNPGEIMTVKARPARTVIHVKSLKNIT